MVSEQGCFVLLKDFEGGVIMILEGMCVCDFVEKFGVFFKDLMKILMNKGVIVGVNYMFDLEMVFEVVEEFGFEVMVVLFEEEV